MYFFLLTQFMLGADKHEKYWCYTICGMSWESHLHFDGSYNHHHHHHRSITHHPIHMFCCILPKSAKFDVKSIFIFAIFTKIRYVVRFIYSSHFAKWRVTIKCDIRRNANEKKMVIPIQVYKHIYLPITHQQQTAQSTEKKKRENSHKANT